MAATVAAPRAESAAPPRPERPGLLRNLSVLSAAEVAVKAGTFLAFTWIARTLGPARYGEIEFTMALMAILALLADGGLSGLGARETARGEVALAGRIAATRLMLASIVYGGLTIWLRYSGLPDQLRGLVGIWGASLWIQPFLLPWFFQGLERMGWYATLSIIRQALFIGVLVAGVWTEIPARWLGLADIVGVLAAAAVGVTVARKILRERIFSRLRIDLGLLREAAPIGLAELCWALQWYLATVQLRLLDHPGGRESLGYYGAAHRITMALHTFVWLYFVNLLPSISRSVTEPIARLESLLHGSLRLASAASVLVALVLTAIPAELFAMAFGVRYESAGPYLGALVWLVPISFLSGHYRYTLIGRDRQGWLLACAASTAAVAASVSWALTPRLGAAGAIIALLMAGVFDLFLTRAAVNRLIHPFRLLRTLAAPAAGALAFGGVYWLLRGQNPWAATAAASCAYALAAVVAR